MADVVVFRSVWSSQTISISTKIIRYITAQRVCLKINASLFDESANTGSLAALANICSRKHLDHSYLQIKTWRHRQITTWQFITNFLISIINLTRSRAFEIENICCIPEFPAQLQCDLKISPHGLQTLVDFWLKQFLVRLKVFSFPGQYDHAVLYSSR